MSGVNLSKASDWVQLTNTLPSLLDLRLSDCQLRPFIPPTPTVNFSSLLTLDLSWNHFENTLILSWIFGLRNLASLDLSGNDFQGPIPVDLQNMTSLSHLNLYWNNFNSSIPNWLYCFSHLEFLSLSHNNLQGTISSAIGNLTSAVSIDLSGNELGGKLSRSLGNLCNLREIRLSENKWSQEISEILKSLSRCVSDRLEILDLRDSQLHGHLTDELEALVYIQGRYTKVNIDNNTKENVTLELVKSGIFEFGVLLELLYKSLSSASSSSFLNLFTIIVSSLG
ncbi:hypothetical protein CMV_012551 [Castanea mollissima]|uniref:Uncharacterized protein n=1 Tax=Castanea mollissima TaxID=60419 RepID=A0A8J4RHD0_9ROSI|nr:hypothetical protein CMV_012551 [Castanea mollissima]